MMFKKIIAVSCKNHMQYICTGMLGVKCSVFNVTETWYTAYICAGIQTFKLKTMIKVKDDILSGNVFPRRKFCQLQLQEV
jgi:hypothetical protein